MVDVEAMLLLEAEMVARESKLEESGVVMFNWRGGYSLLAATNENVSRRMTILIRDHILPLCLRTLSLCDNAKGKSDSCFARRLVVHRVVESSEGGF